MEKLKQIEGGTIYGKCDNTDCQKVGTQELTEVFFKQEFCQDRGESAWWCQECIKRDEDMLLGE